ncbi:hypothetical protein SCLCIDRAFT_10889 [Scleroderma citrinum Foug A]|uniref:Uncharacterized protein n=1 Tax=Scleroderma citrinum Foug A TaxID=1036808 RepID=A0A0C3DIA2_9AGAM|nr:hypothetical protein SCLCIDRAFT_10889 [Scleroderma citrinum Foug A]
MEEVDVLLDSVSFRKRFLWRFSPNTSGTEFSLKLVSRSIPVMVPSLTIRHTARAKSDLGNLPNSAAFGFGGANGTDSVFHIDRESLPVYCSNRDKRESEIG